MNELLLEKKTLGTFMEINPEGFEGWDRINLFLIEVSKSFRYKDEDVEFRIIYKPNFPLEGIVPTLGIKVKYLSVKKEAVASANGGKNSV